MGCAASRFLDIEIGATRAGSRSSPSTESAGSARLLKVVSAEVTITHGRDIARGGRLLTRSTVR
jgi:hypothetical protein